MKKTLVAASALLASLAFAGMAFAQAQQNDSNKPAQPAPAVKATPAVSVSSAKVQTSASAPVTPKAAHTSKPAAMAGHVLSGKIVSVNAVANTVVIKTKQGEMTLNVEPDAKIKVGKETKLADLKAGSTVKVSYKMEGAEKVATRIW